MPIDLKRGLPTILAGAALIGSFALAGTAFAATPDAPRARPAVVGTVASLSGDTLTVTAMKWGRRGAEATPAATYTVDATNATVTKDGAASSVAAIAAGDRVMVQGTVSGTAVTATTIRDGVPGRAANRSDSKLRTAHASSTPAIQGNGEPVVGGAVTALGTNSLTVTAKSGIVYTIDTTSATITKKGVTGATLSDISVGDSVVVQGTVNGTAVTASSVIDSGTPRASAASGATPAAPHGFMGLIGGFFSRLFGFF